ncbi:Hypothetical_protein [Hexamita inflata]|uniref:Hypothetical_protein n=1 Tax=Hexamita inflata TaxID=28002 RepID=A0AA86TQX4_9EUKA|nr:Hypothetical protein HINF_LOCUS13006 [Hexamita inflata]
MHKIMLYVNDTQQPLCLNIKNIKKVSQLGEHIVEYFNTNQSDYLLYSIKFFRKGKLIRDIRDIDLEDQLDHNNVITVTLKINSVKLLNSDNFAMFMQSL